MTHQSSKSSRQGIPFGRIGADLKRIFYLRRFLILLVAQLLLVVVVPLMQGLPIGQIILHILTSIVLLAAILAVSDNRKMLLFAIIFSVPALIVIWLQHFLKSQVLSVAGYTIEFLFFGYTSLHIVMYIFRGTIVSIDRLFGAICVYLLIGVTWAMLYAIVETSHPCSFRFNGASGLSADRSQDTQLTANLLYYSFVTISTLGYGDIVPVSRAAQSLSWLEAVVGQLFLAVLVARLVGLYIVAETQTDTPSRPT